MDRETIRQRVMDGVDDQTIDEEVLNGWIQDADNTVQLWRPEEEGLKQTFDFWDYLKELKPYTMTVGQEIFTLPDNFRSFVELRIGADTTPYKVVDYSNRDKYYDHVCWIIGNKLYIKPNSVAAGTIANLLFVHISDEFASDADEPEIESNYHSAYVAYGKAMYYNQQGDTELENKNMNTFIKWMVRKKNDQEIIRMQSNPGGVGMYESFLV
jgi:hypothetical protein